ncbi:MAG: YARHG domain-containing protein [Coprococcus sp.]|nr:YARHG domain-containing protein [Coprococcus sp.]
MKNNTKKIAVSLIVLSTIIIISLLGLGVFMGLSNLKKGSESQPSVTEEELDAARKENTAPEEPFAYSADESIVIMPGGQSAGNGSEDNASADNAQSAQNTSEYIIADSNTRLLTDADVSGLSKEQLRLARNEIMARHGRRFNDASLQEYFDSKSWYQGTVSPEAFDANVNSYINDTERANIDMIKKYE